MSKIIMKENDEFLVKTSSAISGFERKVLTRLYQPIVGSVAFALYLTMLSELEFDKTVTSMKQPIINLCKLMGVSFDDIILAKNKLEGVGLIKTLKHRKENYYIFTLFAPLAPFDFFENPLLDSLLRNQLDNIEYDRNKQYFAFSNIDNNDFEDVSADFEESFVDVSTPLKGNNSRLVKKVNNEIKLNFDYDLFYQKLASFQISRTSIPQEVIEKLPYLSKAYGIGAVDLADIVTRAQIRTGVADLKKVKELCSKYNLEHHVEFVQSNVDTGSTMLNQIIALYDSNDPLEFLSIKFSTPVAESEQSYIYSMMNSYKLNSAIMNAILDYMFEKTDNSFTKPYLEALCASIARKKPKTSYEAYVLLRSSPNKQVSPTVEQNNSSSDEDLDEIIKRNLDKLNQRKAGQ